MRKELTKTQRETLAWCEGFLQEHESVTAADVEVAFGIKGGTARDRLGTLERLGVLFGDIEKGILHYRLGSAEPKRQPNHYVKHGSRRGEILRPITIDEVDAMKERMKYRTNTHPGTRVQYLWDNEKDPATGKIKKTTIVIEALKGYPHGVLFTGRHVKTFITWNELAVYYRHGERKPVGASYGRDEE